MEDSDNQKIANNNMQDLNDLSKKVILFESYIKLAK